MGEMFEEADAVIETDNSGVFRIGDRARAGASRKSVAPAGWS
jgi:hypothetical protein